MPLTDKTIAEMKAGAEELARQRGEHLPDGYMEAMVRTQERHRLLKVWENEGKITIERVMRPHQSGPDKIKMIVAYNLIHCGDHTFDDVDAESRGAYPSELLIANIALALGAGVHKGDR